MRRRFGPLGVAGVVIALAKPLWQVISWASDFEFVAHYWRAIGGFLDSGWGTLATVAAGAVLVLLELRSHPAQTVPLPSSAPGIPSALVKGEIFRDKIDGGMRQGADLLEAATRLSGNQLPAEIAQAILVWADAMNRLLKPKHPGTAAFFLSALPPIMDRYERDLMVTYVQERIKDLERLRGRDD